MKVQCLLQIDVLLQVSGITPGRAATILPAVLGVISLIVGWLTLSRSWRSQRVWATSCNRSFINGTDRHNP